MRGAFAVVLGAALWAAAPLAQAQLLVGGNVGSARVNQGDFDGSDTGYKFHIGGLYRQFLGGEVAFTDFGRLGGDGPAAQAWTPAVIAGIPLGLFRPYGKVGIAFQEVEGYSVREEYSNEEPFYGVGLGIGRERGLALRLEYERYTFEREDVDLAQVGLELRLGKATD